MDVIKGIFGEKELSYMPDDMIICLGKLLDDKVAFMLLDYVNNPEADKGLVERLTGLIGDKIYKNTFHKQVIELGVIDTIKSLSLPTLAYDDVNLDLLIAQFSFLQENRNKLQTYIMPRQSSDYKDFLQHCSKLDGILFMKERDYPCSVKRVEANKNFFCAAHEKNRPTRIGLTISKSRDWEIALNGAKYIKYCNEHQIVDWIRKEF